MYNITIIISMYNIAVHMCAGIESEIHAGWAGACMLSSYSLRKQTQADTCIRPAHRQGELRGCSPRDEEALEVLSGAPKVGFHGKPSIT